MNFLKKLFAPNKPSNQPAEYVLYYRALCHDCEKVKSYMVKKNISFNYLDCELKENQPPLPIFATPALFKGNELLAYGADVITYFEK